MLSAVDENERRRPGDYNTTFARRVALDDPLRCQGRRRFKTVPSYLWPMRCWKIARRGTLYCARCAKASAEVRSWHLPTFYRTHLSHTLTQALALVAENDQQALELREELRLIRVAADQSVTLYGEALDVRAIAVDEETKKKAQQVVDDAAAAMKAALRDVSDHVLTAAKVESLSKDVFSPAAVRQLVDQIVRIAYEACGEEHTAIAERFNEMIRRDLRLLAGDPRGTSITPDQDVLEMDRTVPHEV